MLTSMFYYITSSEPRSSHGIWMIRFKTKTRVGATYKASNKLKSRPSLLSKASNQFSLNSTSLLCDVDLWWTFCLPKGTHHCFASASKHLYFQNVGNKCLLMEQTLSLLFLMNISPNSTWNFSWKYGKNIRM